MATRKFTGNPKHGHSPKGGLSPTYQSWWSMRERCLNTNSPKFKNWGGRGITICERWANLKNGFANFLADMGERPPGTSIDRIDNNGNYELSNCRWATTKEQRSNSRQNRLLTWQGRTQCLSGWAAELGMSLALLIWRLKHWELEKAMTQSVEPRKPRTTSKAPAF